MRNVSVDNTKYIFLTLVAAVPVFLLAALYANSVVSHDQGKLATIVTVYFLIGIYVGRYLSQLWITRHKTISNSLLGVLLLVIIIAIATLFFAAQFTLHLNTNFIKLLIVGFPLLALSITSGMFIKLVRTTIKNQLQEAKAAAEQSQGELKLLQSQLSPHFLFNTLNNVYGLSLSQHEKVPGLLLKLSALLRYSVYDAKEAYVPLKNELDYLNNYIDFEKIRVGDKLELATAIQENIDPSIKIAPLLLIVFIENAFKHAKNTTEQKIYIEITLKIWANSILFSVKNSNARITAQNSILNTSSGFGLDNVAKRLELLYPNEYDLKIDDQDGYYTVMLQVKIK